MEIRARYVQVGAFTLAVLVAGFAFVYWLNNAGALRNQNCLQHPFRGLGRRGCSRDRLSCSTASASARSRGSSSIAAYPRQVLATIAVDRTTPVRADTFVTIDFQGLTGSPVIALAGGMSKQPLATTKSGIPLLIADADGRAEHVAGRARRPEAA